MRESESGDYRNMFNDRSLVDQGGEHKLDILYQGARAQVDQNPSEWWIVVLAGHMLGPSNLPPAGTNLSTQIPVSCFTFLLHNEPPNLARRL